MVEVGRQQRNQIRLFFSYQLAVDKHEALLEHPEVAAARGRGRGDLPGLDDRLGGLGDGGLAHGELGEAGGEGQLQPALQPHARPHPPLVDAVDAESRAGNSN